MKLWSLTAFLHLLQPLARLRGRLRFGLTPWRRRGWHGLVFPWPRTMTLWSEQWRAPEEWLRALEEHVKEDGGVILRGGDYDRWDLAVRGGLLGNARLLMAVEEHGGGKQLARFRTWPKCSPMGLYLTLLAGRPRLWSRTGRSAGGRHSRSASSSWPSPYARSWSAPPQPRPSFARWHV